MTVTPVVHVQRFDQSDDLGWSTLRILTGAHDDPDLAGGPEEWLVVGAKMVLSAPEEFKLRNTFANPRYRVDSDKADHSFYREARRAQQSWLRDCRQIFGKRVARLRIRDTTRADKLLGQLCFTGVLFVEGRHYFPGQWPIDPGALKKRDLTGQVFGQLTVLESMIRARCRCLCKCGQESIVRAKHLITGSTTSCGCRKRALEERHRAKHEHRAWRHSGVILNLM